MLNTNTVVIGVVMETTFGGKIERVIKEDAEN